MNAPARSRVAVRMGERQVDLAVPSGTTVYDVLRAVGVDAGDSRVAVVDSAGRPLDRYAATGDDLTDGAVLHVVALGGAAGHQGRARLGRGGRRAEAREHAVADDVVRDPVAARPPASSWWLASAAAAAGVAAVLPAVGLLGGAARESARGDRLAVAGLLAVAAVALALLRGRPGARGSAWPTGAAGVAGAAAGVLAVDPAMAGAGAVMVLAGLVGALVTVSLRWAVGRRRRDPVADLAAAAAVVLGVAVGVVAATVLLELPGVLAAAALLGAVPLALRAVPVLAVSVPDEQLVDVSVVQRTVSAVRAPDPPRLAEVDDRMVTRVVGSAERRQDAGTMLLAVAAVLLAPAVLLGAGPGPLTRWTAVAACAAVAVALGLAPRTARGASVHWAPRVAATLVVVELAAIAGRGLGGGVLVATLVLVVVGLGAAALSLPIGRGWRSVGLSRLADAVEGLATVLALPLALVAGGAVEALRAMTS